MTPETTIEPASSPANTAAAPSRAAAYPRAERWREFTKKMPGGRPAEPAEIAAAAAFLASPLSAYTSGVVLTIDGGGLFRR